MERRVRRSSGVQCDIVGLMMEWRMVGMRSNGGHIYEGRVLRLWVSDLLGSEVGVRINLFELVLYFEHGNK